MADECPPCSVVLEGGVTSAVIYTTLLSHLSRHYTFRQLGGASSGAVAAAAAAAAEFGRQNKSEPPGGSFGLLSQFPNELKQTSGGPTVLYRLFQPTTRARASFRVAMAALDKKGGDSWAVSAARAALALIANFPVAALLLTLPFIALGWIVVDALWSGPTCSAGFTAVLLCAPATLAAVLAPVASLVLLILWALLVTTWALRENDWGLCSGATEAGFDRAALTPTLHGFFQSLAGLSNGRPLTFGDLWKVPWAEDASETRKPRRGIDLQIITTAVSLARPVRLPGDPGENPLREFFYDLDEWATLFPPDVMKHLITHARPAELTRDDGKKLCALPEPEHWPVLMAARFSLSFPVLLSAVPMYIAVPRREMLRAGTAATQPHFEVRKVYFSDGGITSNCPVHLFDAPLPALPDLWHQLVPVPGRDVHIGVPVGYAGPGARSRNEGRCPLGHTASLSRLHLHDHVHLARQSATRTARLSRGHRPYRFAAQERRPSPRHGWANYRNACGPRHRSRAEAA